jgi:hypothetical protein
MKVKNSYSKFDLSFSERICVNMNAVISFMVRAIAGEPVSKGSRS